MKDLAAGERLGRKFTCAPFIPHGRGLSQQAYYFSFDTTFTFFKTHQLLEHFVEVVIFIYLQLSSILDLGLFMTPKMCRI